eukprot:527803-Alexandrium_andersonii.AAC.1
MSRRAARGANPKRNSATSGRGKRRGGRVCNCRCAVLHEGNDVRFVEQHELCACVIAACANKCAHFQQFATQVCTASFISSRQSNCAPRILKLGPA